MKHNKKLGVSRIYEGISNFNRIIFVKFRKRQDFGRTAPGYERTTRNMHPCYTLNHFGTFGGKRVLKRCLKKVYSKSDDVSIGHTKQFGPLGHGVRLSNLRSCATPVQHADMVIHVIHVVRHSQTRRLIAYRALLSKVFWSGPH